jgi:hypothetical protein
MREGHTKEKENKNNKMKRTQQGAMLQEVCTKKNKRKNGKMKIIQ